MNKWNPLVVSVLVGEVMAGMPLGTVHSASAEKFDAAYQGGTYQISAGSQNEGWRVNTSNCETHHCFNGQGGVVCRRAEFK